MIKIDCISDLHGETPELEGGDLLIVAGDLTASDMLVQYCHFFEWLGRQRYRKKVVIGGNHDGYFVHQDPKAGAKELVGLRPEGWEYLCDSGCEFEGLKIWGSPWTPEFCNWYFMKERGADIKTVWDKIPEGTDILVTHGPPYGVLDCVKRGTRKDKNCGCEELAKAVKRVQPHLHVFGHIHGGYGYKSEYYPNGRLLTSVNCAHMDEDYEPVNSPITVNF